MKDIEMTSNTSTLSPDTGEIPRLRLSEDKTTDLTYAAHGPLLRRPDATGEIQMPRFLEAVPGDQVQPLFPLKRVIDPMRDDVIIDLRRSVPYVIPAELRDRKPGRHRVPGVWARFVAELVRLVSL
jgi:hypothetical protein